MTEGWLIMRAALALLLVLLLVVGLGKLMQRYAHRLPALGLSPATKGPKRMRMLESMPLDPRRRLVLVALDQHEYMIVLGTDQANLYPVNKGEQS
jgi:flagellar protein FliO/FliZ